MNKIIFTFPGQGVQVAGMLHDARSVCTKQIESASEALNEDVLSLDNEIALKSTRAVQLCILIAGVAYAEKLIEQGAKPDFVAGLSIGAFPAAVISGALDFNDAVRLVALRGELMEKAYPSGYGLAAIGGLIEKNVRVLVDSVYSPDNPVYLSNFNAVDQFVIAGSHDAMQKVLTLAKQKGATKADALAVAVPSHCPLLENPAQKLFEAFQTINMKRPSIAYLSGSTGRVLWDAKRIADDLAFNMSRPLYWANAMTAAYERGVRLAVEMPPGSVLTGLAQRVMENGTVVSCQQHGLQTAIRLAKRFKGSF